MEPNTTPATQQQIVDRLKLANNILVTVSSNPTIDQLAATLGITLVLNKLGKHATAVFSGEVPSTINFLKPEATLEKDTNSLRDFIVSLDKSKADKLRYKVEENVVKIFITPYRTSISEKDLEFSQGDFNVEVVLALGVSEQGQLDQAITAHGRILHDATVITFSAGASTSGLGALNWQDPQASSLSEMLATVCQGLGQDVYDSQIATALLTGIVSETERFSNAKTNSKVMALASQLMTAGANQQLIATELEEEAEVPQDKKVSVNEKDKSLRIKHKEQAPEEILTETPVETVSVETQEETPELPEPVEVEAQVKSVEPEKIEIPPEPAEQTAIEQVSLIASVDEPEPTVENHEIEIDDQGTLTIARDKPQGRMIDSTGPTQEPGSGFSANMFNEDEANAVNADPLTTVSADTASLTPFQAPPPTQPLMSHSDFSPAPLPTASEPSAPSDNIVSTPQPTDQNIVDEPLDTPTDNTSSNLPEPDVDAARSAVDNAIGGAPYDPNRPEPLQALNAAAVDLNTQPPAGPVPQANMPPITNNGTAPTPTNNDSSLPPPPPVPPPMFPLNPNQ